MLDSLLNFLTKTGVWQLLFKEGDQFTLAGRGWMFNTACWQTLVMLLIVGVLVYLAIRRGFEPLLLLPIAVGMLLTNLPGANIFHLEYFIADEIDYAYILHHGGFLDMLYLGVKLGIYPCLIFIGIGAMTDFSPLIANPKSLLIGAGAQLGVFIAFAAALLSGQFSLAEAMSIGIIGGADGPTAILVAKTLAPVLLGGIAIAAYSYMALIPMIQPPFMRLLTTKKERAIRMEALRPVSKLEKILFPLIVTAVVGLIVPDALVLIGCLMFGNLLNVCGVTDGAERTDEHRHHLPRHLGGGNCQRGELPAPADSAHHRAGAGCLLYLHLWRTADRKAHECHLRRYHQPAHRFCRRVCRADGGARLPA